MLTMKKFLLALLMFAGLAALASDANAGGYSRRHYGYDDRYRHSYRSYRHYDYCAPRVRVYHAPVRYYRSYDYCEPRYRYYSRPRFAFSFGF